MSDEAPSTCPSCEKPMSVSARFCSHCGDTIVVSSATSCPFCKAVLKVSKAKFCDLCGENIHTQLARDIQDAEVRLVSIENDPHANAQDLIQALEAFAALLKDNRLRLLEAANYSARARVLREKLAAQETKVNPNQTGEVCSAGQVSVQRWPQPLSSNDVLSAGQNNAEETDCKLCPFCAETIKARAVVCKHCKTSLVTHIPTGHSSTTNDSKARRSTRHCPSCAETVLSEAAKCRFCGSALSGAVAVAFESSSNRISAQPANARDPLLMAFYSGCCIAGMGQMLLGQIGKGFVILLGTIIAAALSGGVTVLVTWPLGAIDAYAVATKLKNGKSVGAWEWF